MSVLSIGTPHSGSRPAAEFVRLGEPDLENFYCRFLTARAEPIFIDIFRPMPCPSLHQFKDYFATDKRPLWTQGPPAEAQGYFALHHLQTEHALAHLDFCFFAGCPQPGSAQATQFWEAVRHRLPEWGLTRLQSFMLASSTDKILLLDSLGFRREGLLREHYFHDGRLHDLAVQGWMAEGRGG